MCWMPMSAKISAGKAKVTKFLHRLLVGPCWKLHSNQHHRSQCKSRLWATMVSLSKKCICDVIGFLRERNVFLGCAAAAAARERTRRKFLLWRHGCLWNSCLLLLLFKRCWHHWAAHLLWWHDSCCGPWSHHAALSPGRRCRNDSCLGLGCAGPINFFETFNCVIQPWWPSGIMNSKFK